jgi:general secretion pathway protein D
MIRADFRRILASTLASCAVLMVATAPLAEPRLALAQTPAFPANAASHNDEPRITLNFEDQDIRQIADAVAMATHKTFITDPRVRAQVTMRSSTPVTPEAFYQIFLSILQVHHYIAVPGAAGSIKIVPDADERTYPGSEDLTDRVSATSDEVITQVVPVKNVSALQLQTVLRPLMANTAQISAYTPANMIIISDHAANVSRIMKIIAILDHVSDAEVEVIPLQNASATEVVRELSSLYQGQAAQDPGVQPLKLAADDRSNSVMLSGEPAARLRARALIANLDTPLQGGGDTEVVYLHYGDAKLLEPLLKQQLSGVAAAAAGAGGAAGGTTPAAQESKNAQIWADVTNNALVITGPAKIRRQIRDIIDKLDIRRPEVLVQAIIVDVDLAKSSELGVNWATWSETGSGTTIPGATFLTPVGGATLVDLANAIVNPTNINAALESGTTVALGRVAQSGISFAAMLRAIRSDTDSNIIATPSALTTDQQEAVMKAADEVPFVTGQYTNTGTSGGSVSPFQTIQREEVGTILKVTPRINEGDAIILKIDVESSSVIPSPAGAVDITTSKREITTNVLIEDGGIIVIGGLISNEYDHSESRVPWLGSIPVLGELFKDHSATSTKKNLMIFIRTQIMHDATETAVETNSKYNFIREEQRQVGASDRGSIPLLPGIRSPVLPPLPPPPTPAPAPAAPSSAPTASSAPRAQQ